MSRTTPPPELPACDHAADERTTLLQMLDRYRAILLRKTWGVSDDQLGATVPPSMLSLGGLLFHMALVEDWWFDHRFLGRPEREPWLSAPWSEDPDWEFHTAPTLTHAELVAQFETSLARSRAAVDQAETLDVLSVLRAKDDTPWSLRWILVHLIEEYARHCGHADLLREAVDGATGD